MSLADRISVQNPDDYNEPEDVFGSGLGAIFPGAEINVHGDPGETLVYRSPHLAAPLLLRLADPTGEAERTLFSHYVWNASLLLAELIEGDTLGVPLRPPRASTPSVSFSVAGRRVVELGAGAGLGSIMAALVGAQRVVATDYPSETVLAPLRENVRAAAAASVQVASHAWGALDDAWIQRERHAFDRVIAADVLWMPWQHDNLRRSVEGLLARDDPAARAWIISALHTGRAAVVRFVDAEALARCGLVVEHIWERDCFGTEREWREMQEDDAQYRKRWLIVIVLKRI